MKELILRHWRSNSPNRRRKLIWISPELYLDTTLSELRDSIKYSDWFVGIDVSIQGGEESGLDEDAFFRERVYEVVTKCRDCIIVFDDLRDSYGSNRLRQLSDRCLRTSRHMNTTCIPIYHSIRSGIWTQQVLSSVKHLVVFPMSAKGKVAFFFRDCLGMTIREARKLVQKLTQRGRAAVVRMHAPAAVWTDRYLKLL